MLLPMTAVGNKMGLAPAVCDGSQLLLFIAGGRIRPKLARETGTT